MRTLVNIDVPELAPAIEFYTSALDLRLSRILDDDVAELTGASCEIYLLANGDGTAAARSIAESRRYSRHWTPVHIDFVVDDIRRRTKQVLKAGASQESECIEWRGSKCITFSDPFGHGFCLIQFTEKTYTEGRSRSGEPSGEDQARILRGNYGYQERHDRVRDRSSRVS